MFLSLYMTFKKVQPLWTCYRIDQWIESIDWVSTDGSMANAQTRLLCLIINTTNNIDEKWHRYSMDRYYQCRSIDPSPIPSCKSGTSTADIDVIATCQPLLSTENRFLYIDNTWHANCETRSLRFFCISLYSFVPIPRWHLNKNLNITPAETSLQEDLLIDATFDPCQFSWATPFTTTD
jgi:hypothetical protein